MPAGYNTPQPYDTDQLLYNGEETPELLVVVAGVQLQDRVLPGTLKVTDRIEERTHAAFVLEDPDSIPDITKGDQVAVRVAGARLFNGVVDEPANNPAGPFGHLLAVPAVDWHYLADRRSVSGGFIDTTAGDIVRWIVAQLDDDDVTQGTVEDGPPVTEVAFAWVSAAKIMDRLATEADFTWHIDSLKRLHFHARGTVPAPWTLDAIDEYAETFRLQRGNRDFRTRQILRGGKAETAPQVEQFVADGTQKTFVVGYPLGREPTVTEDSVAQTVGVKGFGEAGARWLWARGSAELTLAEGEAAPANGVDVQVDYVGLYDLVLVATDQAAASDLRDREGFGTGLVDHVETDTSITSAAQAAERTSRMLAKYARLGRKVTFATSRPGLAAGQLLTANLPDRDLDGVQLLVGQVETIVGQGRVVHTVTAFEGPIEGSWEKWFARNLANRGEPIAFRENLSEEETVIVLAQSAEPTGWAEAIGAGSFTCDTSHATADGFNDPTVGYAAAVPYQGAAAVVTFPASTTGYAEVGRGYNDPTHVQGAVAGGRPVAC